MAIRRRIQLVSPRPNTTHDSRPMAALHDITISAIFLLLVAGCAKTGDVTPATRPPVAEGGSQSTAKKLPEQAVLIHLKLSDQKFGTLDEMDAIHALSARLEQVIKGKHLGMFDGDEFGQGECTLYMYGPDADALFAAIEPLLRSSPLTKAGSATKRYGDAADPNAKELKVTF
jgi:hypothetical protein